MFSDRNLWKIHAWLGLYLGFLMVIFSISGAIIVFKEELKVVFNSSLYKVTQHSGQGNRSLDEIAEVVQQAYPGYSLHNFKFLGPDKPVVVKVKPGAELSKLPDLNVYVDRGSGTINGHSIPETGVIDTITKLHTNLLAGKVGRIVVGISGLALLMMLITGIMIYGNFMKKKRFAQIRWGESIRKVAADWHKLIGITTFVINLIWAITGVTLALLPLVLDKTTGKPYESFARAKDLENPIFIGQTSSYEELEKVVKQNFNEYTIKTIKEVDANDPLLEVKLDAHMPFYQHNASRLLVNKESGHITGFFNIKDASLGAKLYYSQQPLHYGTFAGIWSKVFYAIFGLSSGILFITGYILYLKRKKKQAQSEREEPNKKITVKKSQRKDEVLVVN